MSCLEALHRHIVTAMKAMIMPIRIETTRCTLKFRQAKRASVRVLA